MGYISREEYQKMQQQQASSQKPKTYENSKSIWNFKIKEDGGEAIVRFKKDPAFINVHKVNINGRWQNVNCSTDPASGTICPLCEKGNKPTTRLFIELLEYVRADDGSIKAYPRIWDRPAKFDGILSNLQTEYGDIENQVFKVKKRVPNGDILKTEYDVMLASPQVYNEQLYPKDFSRFEGYEIIGNNVLTETGEPVGQTFTPSVSKPEPATQTVSQAPRKVMYN